MSLSNFKCHYEVLDVPLDASSSEIKKSYRSLVLLHHPDKNLNDSGAEERFKRIQEAYEILSDDREREWYDQHRDDIMRKKSGADGDDDDGLRNEFGLVNLGAFFHSSCFDDYDDGNPDSFWNVYEDVFNEIASTEPRKRNSKGEKRTGSSGSDEIPHFGNSKTPWGQVSDFYDYWMHFQSNLNFSHCDKYDSRDYSDRRIRRAAEKDNFKERKKARKKYVDEVRSLVHFVHRRDTRVKEREELLRVERIEKEAARKLEQLEKVKAKNEAMEKWRMQMADQNSEHERDNADEDHPSSSVYDETFVVRGKSGYTFLSSSFSSFLVNGNDRVCLVLFAVSAILTLARLSHPIPSHPIPSRYAK